jgi:hypothetical protein
MSPSSPRPTLQHRSRPSHVRPNRAGELAKPIAPALQESRFYGASDALTFTASLADMKLPFIDR